MSLSLDVLCCVLFAVFLVFLYNNSNVIILLNMFIHLTPISSSHFRVMCVYSFCLICKLHQESSERFKTFTKVIMIVVMTPFYIDVL